MKDGDRVGVVWLYSACGHCEHCLSTWETVDAAVQFEGLMADHGALCSMSRSGNVWDNTAMESFFSSLKTECTAGKVYRIRDQARVDVFEYIERFYNPLRRHSTIGYVSPMEFERMAAFS